MEASRPVVHPTAQDMELSQTEQALLLTGLARERCILLLTKASVKIAQGMQKSEEGGVSRPGMLGLLPLALAWEGSALAMLAARGETVFFSDFFCPQLHACNASGL